jgi:hypothetical protein
MQHQTLRRDIHLFLTTTALIGMSLFGGCAEHTYQASRLPKELMAPASMDLETINLSGLTDRSVSVDVVQPGDLLEVTMINDYAKLTTTTTPLRVGDDGVVTVPLIGRVTVAGLSVEQAEQTLNSESILRGVFRTPCIGLNMKQYRTNTVSVVGAVSKPGSHDLPRGSSSLMAALVAADGLTKEAGTEVEIRHTDSRPAMAGGPQSAAPYSTDGANGMVSPTAYEQVSPMAAAPIVTRVNLLEATAGRQKCLNFSTATWSMSPSACCGRCT